MTVLILTKEKTEDYETTKLIKSFSDKNIPVRVCYFSKFDVIINLGILEFLKKTITGFQYLNIYIFITKAL
mgnify:CR=1 FL=1